MNGNTIFNQCGPYLLLTLVCGCGPYQPQSSHNRTETGQMMEKDSTGERRINVIVGDETYMIPVYYLSPNRDLPAMIVARGTIDIAAFLPDFRGYAPDDSQIGPYRSDKISASWSSSGGGLHYNADERLKRVLSLELVERTPEGDRFGLLAYRSTTNENITYMAKGSHGSTMMLQYSKGSVNSICRLDYFHRDKQMGVLYLFDGAHLADWKKIDDKIQSMIQAWKQ